jgi:hypothetical protein
MTVIVKVEVPDQPVKVQVTKIFFREERREETVLKRSESSSFSVYDGVELRVIEFAEDDPRVAQPE